MSRQPPASDRLTARAHAGDARFWSGALHDRAVRACPVAAADRRQQSYAHVVRAGRNASLLIEGNYFQDVKSPFEFNNATDQGAAHITARNNTFVNVTGTQATGGGGTPFTSYPYSATIEPPGGVRDVVQRCAGPRP